MNLELRKFDMASIGDDTVAIILGKRGTGKSFLCKDLLYHHQDIPTSTVISATESTIPFYGNMAVPPSSLHDEYSEEIIQKVVTRQKEAVVQHAKDPGVELDPRGVLVLDDCLYDTSWTKSNNVLSIFMNGRCFKMMFIITMQYVLSIPPIFRTNIDYVFILRENIVANRQRIYENYAGMFPSFEVFCQVMDQSTTNDFECLVFSQNAKSSKLEDQVFWYKAEDHPNV
jgi:hypothetical protein